MGAAKVYIETYGCQMNEYDSEIVRRVLTGNGYDFTDTPEDADIIFLNTCAVRANAQRKVLQRIDLFKKLKGRKQGLLIGVLGCVAQNLKTELFNSGIGVDVVAGPDSYRTLPELLRRVQETKETRCATTLSVEETYSDLFPAQQSGKVNAWVAVMRGCDNFCSFCVVPYTRGRERCRAPDNIIEEITALAAKGYKQVTLLGQNVNSYKYEGFTFAQLISAVSRIEGIRRIRFTSPHPKDFPDDLLEVVADNDKVCKHIHLPLQSGNTRILQMMNRTYSKEEYLALAHRMRERIGNLALTTDIIVGFPTETREEYEDTLDVMRQVEFDAAFMFKYSERAGTAAAQKYPDDISAAEKTDRITRLVDLQRSISLERNQRHLNETYDVLVEGTARKPDQLRGRNDENKIVVFPDNGAQAGDFVNVRIEEVTPNTLIGVAVQPVT
ncbi:MAG: tRNA (N6-isopentenyl adenosine(37)-C2)-methylthiotransferase MiaB [candidate division Zixibacteria bacterium]|nr:tRNA (N6-isopentenyl adenosine(37)-C2)-methylthiotransferase MiaB [candidate division Zixibacteria bacterium]